MPPPSRRLFLHTGLIATAGAALAACTPAPPSPAGSAPDAPPIISRAEWGAAEPDHDARAERGLFDPVSNLNGWLVYPTPLADALNTLVVHHSALSETDGALAIQRLHMDRRGYADIGYHFVVDHSGLFYAGRDLNVRGAHTGGANTGTIGVVLLGNFEHAEPPPAQLDALRTLSAYLASAFTLTHIAGHADFQPGATLCPGENLAPLLPDLAAGLGLAFGTGGYVPPAWSRS
jgi:hypothetical protein